MERKLDELTVHTQGISFDHDQLRNITNIKVSKHYGSIRTEEDIKTVYPSKPFVNMFPLNFHLYAIFLCGLFVSISPKSLLFFNVASKSGDKYKSMLLFNISRIVFAPLMGYSCNYFGSIRVLFCSSICLFLASSMNYFTSSLETLLVASMLFGIASSSIIILRGLLIQQVNFSDRTAMMAFILSMQYIGSFLLPIFILWAYAQYEVSLAACALLSTAYIVIVSFYKFPQFGIMGQQQQQQYQTHVNIFTLNPSLVHPHSFVEFSPICDNQHKNTELLGDATDNTCTGYFEKFEMDSNSNDNNNCAITIIDYQQLVMGCAAALITKIAVGIFEIEVIQISTQFFGLGALELSYILPGLAMTGLLPLLCCKQITAVLNDKLILLGGASIISAAILATSIVSSYVVSSSTLLWILVGSVYCLGYPISCIGIGGIVAKSTVNGSQNTVQGWFACSEALASLMMCLITADTLGSISFLELLSLVVVVLSGGLFFFKLCMK